MTSGMFLFISGIGLVALAVALSLFMACTAGRRKRRIDKRMKEKY